MAKFRIKKTATAHGAISWSHSGRDDQYCEAGEDVMLNWQPSAGWGLQEAHYTDGDGNVTAIDLTTRTFTMPSKDVTISGTFKRFDLSDYTDGINPATGEILELGNDGQAVPTGKKISDLATAEQGAKADTAVQSVTVGTTTTGDAGTLANVENSGTETNPVLDFTIPRGADGANGQDAINPFKGWWPDLATLKAAVTAEAGDYAYVADASPATTTSIYVYDSTASSDNYWDDSGRDVDTSNVSSFESGQSLNEVSIIDNLTTNSSSDVLSAKQGKVLKESVFGVPSNIKNIGYYIKSNGELQGDGTSPYEVSDFIPITLQSDDVVSFAEGETNNTYSRIVFFTYNTETTSTSNTGIKYYGINANPRSETVTSTMVSNAHYFRICYKTSNRNNVYVKLNGTTIYTPSLGTPSAFVPTDEFDDYLEDSEVIGDIQDSLGSKAATSIISASTAWGGLDEVSVYLKGRQPETIAKLGIDGDTSKLVLGTNASIKCAYVFVKAGEHVVVKLGDGTGTGATAGIRFGFTATTPADGVDVVDASGNPIGDIYVAPSEHPYYSIIDKVAGSDCYAVITGSTGDGGVPACRFYDAIPVSDMVKNIETGEDRLSERFENSLFANKSNQDKCLTLIHFSDIHGNEDNLRRIVAFKDKWEDSVDDVLCTGDMQKTDFSSTFIFDDTVVDGAEDILMCVGNHDTLSGSTSTLANWYAKAGTQDAFDRYMSNVTTLGGVLPTGAGTSGYYPCYYYKDYSDKGVRLIVLDMMNWGKDILNESSNLQSSWLDDVLSDAKTAGLHVVIAEHFPFLGEDKFNITKKADVLESDFSLPNRIPSYVSGSIDGQMIVALDAIKSKVESFKTAGGIFVCWICGHTHFDVLEKVIDTTQRVIVIGTASSTNDSNTIRHSYDDSMDLFNIFSVDTINRVVKVFRVGSHMTPSLQKIDTMYFTY